MANNPANPANPGRARKPSKPTRSRTAASRADVAPDLPAPVEASAPAPLTLADEAAPNSVVARTGGFREPLNRSRMIAEAAYYRAERRGFAPGFEQQDWFEAEREVDAALESTLDGGSSGHAH